MSLCHVMLMLMLLRSGVLAVLEACIRLSHEMYSLMHSIKNIHRIKAAILMCYHRICVVILRNPLLMTLGECTVASEALDEDK